MFFCEFCEMFENTFLQNTSGRLLLFRVNKVSDHCARNIYIKVFLWIIVPWMLVPSKILRISKNTWSISKFVRKCLLYVGCRSSTRTFTRSFILQDFLSTLGALIFRNTWKRSLFNIFWLQCAKIYSFDSSKNKTPCAFFLQTDYF